MKIKYYAQTSEWSGGPEEDLTITGDSGDGVPVRQILSRLASRHGDLFKMKIYNPASDLLQEDIFLLLNGRHLARLSGMDTRVQENDVLAVIPVTEAG